MCKIFCKLRVIITSTSTKFIINFFLYLIISYNIKKKSIFKYIKILINKFNNSKFYSNKK